MDEKPSAGLPEILLTLMLLLATAGVTGVAFDALKASIAGRLANPEFDPRRIELGRDSDTGYYLHLPDQPHIPIDLGDYSVDQFEMLRDGRIIMSVREPVQIGYGESISLILRSRGSEDVVLHSPQHLIYPVTSPDGDFVSFMEYAREEAGHYNIVIIDLNNEEHPAHRIDIDQYLLDAHHRSLFEIPQISILGDGTILVEGNLNYQDDSVRGVILQITTDGTITNTLFDNGTSAQVVGQIGTYTVLTRLIHSDATTEIIAITPTGDVVDTLRVDDGEADHHGFTRAVIAEDGTIVALSNHLGQVHQLHLVNIAEDGQLEITHTIDIPEEIEFRNIHNLHVLPPGLVQISVISRQTGERRDLFINPNNGDIRVVDD